MNPDAGPKGDRGEMLTVSAERPGVRGEAQGVYTVIPVPSHFFLPSFVSSATSKNNGHESQNPDSHRRTLLFCSRSSVEPLAEKWKNKTDCLLELHPPRRQTSLREEVRNNRDTGMIIVSKPSWSVPEEPHPEAQHRRTRGNPVG